jgi:hypothetical protein
VLILVAAIAALGAACDPPVKSGTPDTPAGITRERAIEIARHEIRFDATSVEADRVTADGVTVWRVTLKGRLPDQPPGLFETRIFDIDVQSGKIVSASMN